MSGVWFRETCTWLDGLSFLAPKKDDGAGVKSSYKILSGAALGFCRMMFGNFVTRPQSEMRLPDFSTDSSVCEIPVKNFKPSAHFFKRSKSRPKPICVNFLCTVERLQR
jgi:hypothetical protein